MADFIGKVPNLQFVDARRCSTPGILVCGTNQFDGTANESLNSVTFGVVASEENAHPHQYSIFSAR